MKMNRKDIKPLSKWPEKYSRKFRTPIKGVSKPVRQFHVHEKIADAYAPKADYAGIILFIISASVLWTGYILLNVYVGLNLFGLLAVTIPGAAPLLGIPFLISGYWR